jgi:hypothetical protein
MRSEALASRTASERYRLQNSVHAPNTDVNEHTHQISLQTWGVHSRGDRHFPLIELRLQLLQR